MKKIKKLSFYLMMIALLTQCKTSTHKDNTRIARATDTGFNFLVRHKYDFMMHELAVHPTSLIGDWEYSFPFYSSELTILKDGTFRFHERGCTGQSFSEGTWIGTKERLLITSYDSYAMVDFSKRYNHPSTFTGQKKKRLTLKFNLTPDTFLINNSYFSKIKVHSFDSSTIYFNHTQLLLEGDTLYEIGSDGLKTYTKYTLAKRDR